MRRRVHYEDPLTGEPLEGLEALGEHAARLWAAFPDARMEQTGERLSDEHFVAAPCKVLATHRAALEGLPATNRFVVVHAIFYCEMKHESCCGSAASSTSTTSPLSSGSCRRAGRSVRRRC